MRGGKESLAHGLLSVLSAHFQICHDDKVLTAAQSLGSRSRTTHSASLLVVHLIIGYTGIQPLNNNRAGGLNLVAKWVHRRGEVGLLGGFVSKFGCCRESGCFSEFSCSEVSL